MQTTGSSSLSLSASEHPGFFFHKGTTLREIQRLLRKKFKTNNSKENMMKRKLPKSVLNACLVEACRMGELNVISKLLLDGADPNGTDAIGFSPLMISAAKGDLITTSILTRFGADVNAENFTGYKIIEYAKKSKNERLVVFIENGQFEGSETDDWNFLK